MGKREADNQLTQDNWENDDAAGEGGSGDFRKADERALAGRKIRGLPKRRGAGGGAAPAPPAPAEAAPKASQFGFAAPAAASPKPFAALSSAPAVPAATPFGASSFGAPTGKPATNGTAPAAPTFSFGATSSFSAPPPAPTSSTSTPASSSGFSFGSSSFSASAPKTNSSSSSAASGQSAAHKYYTSLRALNVSLLDSLTSELDKDPFLDLSASVFDKLKSKYAEHRSKVQKEFDQAEGRKTNDSSMAVDKPAVAPAFEIPEIFRNPPKAVPIADLTPKDSEDDGIPAIFKNPPKPVPIADLSEKKDDRIPDIFKNPPKAVPIADLTEKKEEKAAPPAAPAAFSFAGSTVKAAPAASASGSSAPPAGGFVFKADAPADPYAEKSSFSFPVPPTSSAASSASSTPTTTSKADDRSSFKAPSAPKLAPAKLTNPPAKPSPLRFGQSVSPPTSPEKAGDASEAKKDEAAKKPAFNFGAAFGNVAKGETAGEKKVDEGKKAEEEKKEDAAKPAFGGFGSGPSSSGGFSFTPSASTSTSNPFAPSSSSTTPAKSLFGAAPTPFTTPATSSLASKPAAASPPIASSFGAGSPPTFGFGAALQGKDKDKAIGAASGAARNTGFGFGSSIGGTLPSTSSGLGGVSGFSFGSGIATGAGEKTGEDKNQPAKLTTGFSFASSNPAASTSSSASAPTPAPAFSFSAAPSAPLPAAAASRTASVAPSDASETTDSAPQTPGGNPFAAPGEGEEGETVLHAVRAKVWRLEGGQQELLGVANVQLKEKEEDGKSKVRMLARNETNGVVLINFSLHSSFSLKCEKVFATFTGFDSSAKPVIYRLRVKTKEMVDEFEQEVEKAKGKLA
ncbi:hypothetical protein JCM11251_006327 [Rhodosporidiobolus azoricus]